MAAPLFQSTVMAGWPDPVVGYGLMVFNELLVHV
jgi:hypothetical protein